MTNTQDEVARRLSALSGLQISGVNHAADMLTLQFGALTRVANFKGELRYVGEWALHIQCFWRLEQDGIIIATRDDLCGPDEKARVTTGRLQKSLIESDRFVVESMAADERAALVLTLSGHMRLVVIPDGIEEEEDWRFFAHSSEERHFMIEGGKIHPRSMS